MNPTEEWRLDTSHFGKHVLVFDRLDSTNSFALARAHDAANDGLVILADEQTAGRGQHGRSWSCPGGGGVLMSVLLFPPRELHRPAILTAWIAVTVCEMIRKTFALRGTIKWPNDVLIEGRKICGILIEEAHGTVAGIGLNVNQPAEHFTSLRLPHAASLAMFTGQQSSCREMARRLILELDSEYQRLLHDGIPDLERHWQELIGLVGKNVKVEGTRGSHTGRLRKMSFAGLQLETATGLTHLVPESVRHLHELA